MNRCDLCQAKDDGPHFHAFIKKGKRTIHHWICGSCKKNLQVDEEHRDDG